MVMVALQLWMQNMWNNGARQLWEEQLLGVRGAPSHYNCNPPPLSLARTMLASTSPGSNFGGSMLASTEDRFVGKNYRGTGSENFYRQKLDQSTPN